MMNSCLKDNGWKETVCFVVSFISRWSISRTGHEADARYCPHWVSGGGKTSSRGETILGREVTQRLVEGRSWE